MVPELLARIDRWLSTSRPDYYARLQPGVTAAQLDQFEERFSVRLPVAFRLLYKWRNGQEPTYFRSIQMNWMLMPLEDIADTKGMLDGMIGSDFASSDWWRREWVPFLHNGGGDRLVVDLGGFDGGQPRQLLTFWHDDPDRPVSYPNLEAWLTDLADSMEDGSLELV